MVGEAFTPMRNIIFDSCVIQASNRGLGIHHSHNSIIENVVFSNMVIETRLFHEAWWGRAEPIYICAMPWTPDVQMGQVRHALLQHPSKGENGVFVYGREQDTCKTSCSRTSASNSTSGRRSRPSRISGRSRR
ncbi:MAG: hypothetical protein IPK19_00010 [Chloroflexi bacterium]|nr:hypothetical protein [Chloroflexota bacterium]